MSTYTTCLNAYTMDRYDLLKEEGREPQLAVYRGKRLIIYSKKENGVVGKVGGVFRAFKMKLLVFLGLVKIDHERVEALQQEMLCYHAKKVGMEQILSEFKEKLLLLEQQMS